MYGQGHLVPIGNIAMQPQQPYGYVAPAAQGMEGTPLPIMPMAVAPHAAHLQQQGALPMFADYHTTASAQVRSVLRCTSHQSKSSSMQGSPLLCIHVQQEPAARKPAREPGGRCETINDAP